MNAYMTLSAENKEEMERNRVKGRGKRDRGKATGTGTEPKGILYISGVK